MRNAAGAAAVIHEVVCGLRRHAQEAPHIAVLPILPPPGFIAVDHRTRLHFLQQGLHLGLQLPPHRMRQLHNLPTLSVRLCRVRRYSWICRQPKLRPQIHHQGCDSHLRYALARTPAPSSPTAGCATPHSTDTSVSPLGARSPRPLAAEATRSLRGCSRGSLLVRTGIADSAPERAAPAASASSAAATCYVWRLAAARRRLPFPLRPIALYESPGGPWLRRSSSASRSSAAASSAPCCATCACKAVLGLQPRILAPQLRVLRRQDPLGMPPMPSIIPSGGTLNSYVKVSDVFHRDRCSTGSNQGPALLAFGFPSFGVRWAT